MVKTLILNYSDIQARYIYITVDSKAIKFKNLTNAKESKLTNMVITLYQPYENQNRSEVRIRNSYEFGYESS